MSDSAESTIDVYNSLTASAFGTIWRPEGWQAADVGGQIAGSVGMAGAGVTDPEAVTAAINALKLARGVLGTPDILFGATIGSQFSELPAGATVDLWHEQVNGLTAPFTASLWAEMFGENDLTIVITSPYGAVTFGARRGDADFSVTRYGVRHGTDPNGDGHFHRWGEGGHYTHINTSVSPAIVTYGGAYHLFFQERDGPRIFHATSTDGYSWSALTYLGVDSSAAVCAVVYYGDQLHLFARDPNGNRYFDYGSTDGGSTFSLFNSTIQDGDGQPSAAALGEALCMVVQDHDGAAVMFSTYDGSGWQPGDTGMRTSAAPGLIAYGGYFHLFFRDGQPNHNGILHAYSVDGINWPSADANGLGPFYIGYNCSNSPRPFIYKDKLKIVFRDGADNAKGILCLTSDDGFNFAPEPPDWYLGMNCDANPSGASLGANACVVCMDYDGNGIMTIMPDLS